jgi:hypothetical protein
MSDPGEILREALKLPKMVEPNPMLSDDDGILFDQFKPG